MSKGGDKLITPSLLSPRNDWLAELTQSVEAKTVRCFDVLKEGNTKEAECESGTLVVGRRALAFSSGSSDDNVITFSHPYNCILSYGLEDEGRFFQYVIKLPVTRKEISYRYHVKPMVGTYSLTTPVDTLLLEVDKVFLEYLEDPTRSGNVIDDDNGRVAATRRESNFDKLSLMGSRMLPVQKADSAVIVGMRYPIGHLVLRFGVRDAMKDKSAWPKAILIVSNDGILILRGTGNSKKDVYLYSEIRSFGSSGFLFSFKVGAQASTHLCDSTTTQAQQMLQNVISQSGGDTNGVDNEDDDSQSDALASAYQLYTDLSHKYNELAAEAEHLRKRPSMRLYETLKQQLVLLQTRRSAVVAPPSLGRSRQPKTIDEVVDFISTEEQSDDSEISAQEEVLVHVDEILVESQKEVDQRDIQTGFVHVFDVAELIDELKQGNDVLQVENDFLRQQLQDIVVKEKQPVVLVVGEEAEWKTKFEKLEVTLKHLADSHNDLIEKYAKLEVDFEEAAENHIEEQANSATQVNWYLSEQRELEEKYDALSVGSRQEKLVGFSDIMMMPSSNDLMSLTLTEQKTKSVGQLTNENKKLKKDLQTAVQLNIDTLKKLRDVLKQRIEQVDDIQLPVAPVGFFQPKKKKPSLSSSSKIQSRIEMLELENHRMRIRMEAVLESKEYGGLIQDLHKKYLQL